MRGIDIDKSVALPLLRLLLAIGVLAIGVLPIEVLVIAALIIADLAIAVVPIAVVPIAIAPIAVAPIAVLAIAPMQGTAIIDNFRTGAFNPFARFECFRVSNGLLVCLC
eukprot:scaffold47554_cov64-Attheya_sp.AAC.1